MDSIWNWITKWDKDKILHFCICLIISMVAACLVKMLGGDKFSVLGGAWFAGFFAGVIKEINDEIKYQGADEGDWAADIIGTTLGTTLSFLFVA